ncbi:recombinase family protein [Georgenia soli]|nr:recombinase family protein [Georgenia soli]
MSRRCAVYARISVSSEESVSIERQLRAAEQYVAARGWQVVVTYTDDGVSATRNRPEDRTGWRALMDSTETFDAVIIWKIDRLARRITDFWSTVQVLEERDRSLVSIQDNLDMSTTVGQIVAGVMAGFAQMEAEAIRDRVTAARRHLLHNGRIPGGTIPYGWRTVPNPDGAGRVLAQDPERIEYVRGAVERVQHGASIYSVVQWLDDVSAPLPRASQKGRKRTGWHYGTVERLIRNPVLAGMLPYNPGNATKVRGEDVVRDEHGLPVVDEKVALLPVAEWRALVRQLDERDSGQSKPRALRSKTSPLLSGLVWCAMHDDAPVRMHRGTTQKRHSYYCPKCHQAISNIEPHVIEQFLALKGEHVRWSVVEEVYEGGAALLPEIEQRLDELDAAIRGASSRDERRRLQDQQATLLDLRDEKRAEAPQVVLREVQSTHTYGEDWAEATTVEEQRAVLDDALEAIEVRRGRVGRGLDTSRLTFRWKMPHQLGAVAAPSDEELASWAAS